MRRFPFVALALLLATFFSVWLGLGAGSASAAEPAQAPRPDFGPNVLIIDPSTPRAVAQEKIDAIWAAQGGAEFGTGRHAILLMPGTYDLDVRVDRKSVV
jgi:hypothetical protein